MIDGAHAILYSRDADADRAFLADVLGGARVDAGGGWLIVALPPSEIAVHPTDGPPSHELFFLCDDIDATIPDLTRKGAEHIGDISDERWGRLARFRLPGGSEIGVYEPKHPRARDGS